jgi:hypothetical protein
MKVENIRDITKCLLETWNMCCSEVDTGTLKRAYWEYEKAYEELLNLSTEQKLGLTAGDIKDNVNARENAINKYNNMGTVLGHIFAEITANIKNTFNPR